MEIQASLQFSTMTREAIKEDVWTAEESENLYRVAVGADKFFVRKFFVRKFSAKSGEVTRSNTDG